MVQTWRATSRPDTTLAQYESPAGIGTGFLILNFLFFEGWIIPSHQTPPSGVTGTSVKIVLRRKCSHGIGLVVSEVPGATPKKPASGLIALNLVWPDPCDIVADRGNLPTFRAKWRNHHGAVRFSAGGREGRRSAICSTQRRRCRFVSVVLTVAVAIDVGSPLKNFRDLVL